MGSWHRFENDAQLVRYIAENTEITEEEAWNKIKEARDQ